MSMQCELTTKRILAIFDEEITAHGGNISDTFADGNRLFARSLLPWVKDVRPRDQVQGGVALRATDREAWVHPYVFRQVCKNGAIMAQAIQSRHVARLNCLGLEEGSDTLREAIRECCVEDAFSVSAEKMRTARETEVDMALNMLPMLSQFPEVLRNEILRGVLERYFADTDQSSFGLMNAVTSLARDTRDPDMRWRLEELGGGIAARIRPRPSRDNTAARRARRRVEAMVG